MKSKTIIIVIGFLLWGFFCGGAGFLIAFIQGFERINHAVIQHEASTLLVDSLSYIRLDEDIEIETLIEEVIRNRESSAQFLQANESFIRSSSPTFIDPDITLEKIRSALEEWEKAKDELEKLKSILKTTTSIDSNHIGKNRDSQLLNGNPLEK